MTAWELYVRQPDGSMRWEHNHVSDGYDPAATYPEPKDPSFTSQRGWKQGTWRQREVRLVNGKLENVNENAA